MSRFRSTLNSIFRHAQRDALEEALEHPQVDRKVIAVLVTACVILTLQQYIFRAGSFEVVPRLLDWLGAGELAAWIYQRTYRPQDHQLAQLLFWAAGSVINYVVLPCVVIKLYLRERIAGYGLKVRGILGSSWLYLLMFLAMIGPLAFFSRTEAFQAKYPFYHPLPGEPFWPRLWLWEAAYVCQFFALEFLLPRFHGPRAAAAVGVLRRLRDDRALLHDPLCQADAGDLRGDRRGDRAGDHEPEDAVDLAGGVPARGCGGVDGFSGAVAPGNVVEAASRRAGNAECRKSNDERNPNSECPNPSSFEPS